MPDISLSWNVASQRAEWQFGTGDLLTGSDLESAVLVSLFTDGRAPADYIPTDGSNNRRGHWSDSFEPSPVGSALWTFRRRKKTDDTSLLIEISNCCKIALDWMLKSGIAASVDAQAIWIAPDAIGLTVTITEPLQSTLHTFNFSWSWNFAPPSHPPEVPSGAGDRWGVDFVWGVSRWS